MAKTKQTVTETVTEETYQGRFKEVMETLADSQWKIQQLKEDIQEALSVIPGGKRIGKKWDSIQSTIEWLEEADTDLEGLVWQEADLSALDAKPKKVRRIDG